MTQVVKRFSISFARLFICVFCLLITIRSFVSAQTTTFHVPLDFALTVDWSPDGAKLAVGGGAQGFDPDNELSHAIYILDASTGEILNTLVGHISQVNTVTWSPDSKLLVSGGDEGLAYIWDVDTGKIVSSVQALKGFMARAGQKWSADGTKIADYYAGDHKAFTWDAQTGEVLQTFEFAGLVTSVGWPHSGNQLAIGELNAIHIVDSDMGEPQSILSVPITWLFLRQPICPLLLHNGHNTSICG